MITYYTKPQAQMVLEAYRIPGNPALPNKGKALWLAFGGGPAVVITKAEGRKSAEGKALYQFNFNPFTP